MNKNKGYQSLRKGRYSESGFVYHVTIATKNRRRVFQDFYSARMFIQIIRSDDICRLSDTLAFVVMPDHIHWLFSLKEGVLSSFVQRAKSFFTKAYGEAIWQDGFYDHAIRSDESLINVARYIVANPIRAGLVKSVRDYPHWDSVWLE